MASISWHGDKEMYKAAVLHSPQHLIMEQRAKPQIGDKEALIRVGMAGVCGTDIAIYSGNYTVPLPLVLGHEFVGVVVEIGSQVSPELVGKLATAEINNTCVSYGSDSPCAACARGMPNHCLRRTVLGIMEYDGAFAELVKVPANNIHPLTPGISLEEAVFIEPLAAAIQTFKLTEVRPGDIVVVLGAGRLGILVVAVAAIMGARVAAVSRSEDKLERCLKYGASLAINAASEDVVSRVMAFTEGLGADVVVEATGSADAIQDPRLGEAQGHHRRKDHLWPPRPQHRYHEAGCQ